MSTPKLDPAAALNEVSNNPTRSSHHARSSSDNYHGDALSASSHPSPDSAAKDRRESMNSVPPSPGLLTRNTSFSNTSEFQEDWEVAPMLEKASFLDLLDNFAIPRQLEKWQTTVTTHGGKVRRQAAQRLKSTGQIAKDRVVEEWRKRVPTPDEQLEKYKRRVRESVDRLGSRWKDTKVVTLREKFAFIAGVMNIFISGWFIGAMPEYFHYWYSAQFALLMPIRLVTYRQRGYHYFLADLCYFVNMLLLLSIWVLPQSKRLLISTYCLAYGNNAIAIAMWRNSMVFHSLDKVTRYVSSSPTP
jgi:hypothetical protein